MPRPPDNLVDADELGEALLEEMEQRAADCLGVPEAEVSFLWGDTDKETCGYEVRERTDKFERRHAGKCLRGESGFTSLLEALDAFLEWCGDDDDEEDELPGSDDIEEPED